MGDPEPLKLLPLPTKCRDCRHIAPHLVSYKSLVMQSRLRERQNTGFICYFYVDVTKYLSGSEQETWLCVCVHVCMSLCLPFPSLCMCVCLCLSVHVHLEYSNLGGWNTILGLQGLNSSPIFVISKLDGREDW